MNFRIYTLERKLLRVTYICATSTNTTAKKKNVKHYLKKLIRKPYCYPPGIHDCDALVINDIITRKIRTTGEQRILNREKATRSLTFDYWLWHKFDFFIQIITLPQTSHDQK